MNSAFSVADWKYMKGLVLLYEEGCQNVERDELLPFFGLSYREAKELIASKESFYGQE